MCATAIAWSSFESITYGTSIDTLSKMGWSQIPIPTSEILGSAKGVGLATGTRLVKDVLRNETDPFYAWQFDAEGKCPTGCVRGGKGGCVVEGEKIVDKEL